MSETAVAIQTGASPAIFLFSEGEYRLNVKSAGAFELDLQEGDGTNYSDVYYDGSNKVVLGSTDLPVSVIVTAPNYYRMNVTTYNSAITLTATRITK